MTPIWEQSQTWDIHTCTPSCIHNNSHDTYLGTIPNMGHTYIHVHLAVLMITVMTPIWESSQTWTYIHVHLAVSMITVMTPIWESSQTWTYIHVHLAVYMITVMTPIWEPSQTWDIHTCTPSCIHDNSHDTCLQVIPNMGHTYMYT